MAILITLLKMWMFVIMNDAVSMRPLCAAVMEQAVDLSRYSQVDMRRYPQAAGPQNLTR